MYLILYLIVHQKIMKEFAKLLNKCTIKCILFCICNVFYNFAKSLGGKSVISLIAISSRQPLDGLDEFE